MHIIIERIKKIINKIRILIKSLFTCLSFNKSTCLFKIFFIRVINFTIKSDDNMPKAKMVMLINILHRYGIKGIKFA